MSIDQANNWKSRAEWMLSQFIDGGIGGGVGDGFDHEDDGDGAADRPYFSSSSPLLENYSTSEAMNSYGCVITNSCHRSRRMGGDFGYDCCGVGGSCCIGKESPCASLMLHWTKWLSGGAIKAYLSNPLCLALLPLILGVAVGFWVGRHPSVGVGGKSTTNDNNRGKQKQSTAEKTSWGQTTLLAYLFQLYHYLSLRLMITMIYLDPRRRLYDKELFQKERDDQTRTELLQTIEIERESGIEPQFIPRHIAVIMDGNRRYGKTKYGNVTRGHWDGSKTLIEFSKWCISEGVQILTVYAFSTENWDREASEVSSLMAIFCKYCDELRVEAIRRGICIRVLTTDETKIPDNVKVGMNRMVSETKHCDKFIMNICMSYGGRGEIVNACKSMAMDIKCGNMHIDEVDERMLQSKMLTQHCCDPDIVIRTSGEERLSNFLLWQVAYSEFFFLKKHWPEMEKEDLLEVIRTFARGRKRRYGK
ncbi:hypothetical protein ACHAWU_006522 [Discostella pseudostelligera]|uniref:Alkyl transferase n=1 Tax=Discostella pseudostelligera TaxID=259834 RepID=A0ABD3MD24_9STRA